MKNFYQLSQRVVFVRFFPGLLALADAVDTKRRHSVNALGTLTGRLNLVRSSMIQVQWT